MNIENIYMFPKGTICVARECGGVLVCLKVHDQWKWQEYSYAFSVL